MIAEFLRPIVWYKLKGDAVTSKETSWEKDAAWWKDFLTPLAQEASLPADFQRSKVYSSKRACLTVSTEGPLATLTQAQRSQSPQRLALAIQTSVIAVLYRYLHESRVSIGLSVDNGDERSPLPIVIDLDDKTTLEALSLRVSQAISAAQSHSQVSFEEIKNLLGLEAIVNRNPIFSVGVRLKSSEWDIASLRNDVTVALSDTSEKCSLEFDYSARLFLPETVRRFAGHVQAFLRAFFTAPWEKLNSIDYLTDDERRLITVWNDTAAPFPRNAAIHDLLTEQAARTPNTEALVFEGRSYNYAWLESRSNRLARVLTGFGAARGQVVGLCVSPSPEMIISLLAILKTGAAVMPLDPTFPEKRLTFMLEDASPKFVLTERALLAHLAEQQNTIFLEGITGELGASSHAPFISNSTGEDPLYLLFTSGSTGRPKGVLMRHRALVNLVCWQKRDGRDALGKRTLQRTSLGFDVSFQEIFSTLCSGGSLVIATDSQRSDISRLPETVQKYRISRLFLPPVALHQFAEAATEEHSLDSLEELIVAGEQLRITMPVVQFFHRTRALLVNQYGPTEAHVVTSHSLSGPSLRWPKLPPIGKPIHNCCVHILNAETQLVPVGVTGEIYIGGEGVALGYTGQGGQSAEAFVPDPFSANPGDRLYKTGDMARYLPDGSIEFIGRRDGQVKIRGYRIELGEIESVLMQMQCVREAKVTTSESEGGDRHLVAYFVAADSAPPSVELIRQFLSERLPEHMVPASSHIVRLTSMPLTATGKIDAGALPPPELNRAHMSIAFVPPQNAVEAKIAEIWGKVLRVDKIGLRDEFLALGGHSLLAIRIISQINCYYGISLPLGALLRKTTIAELARSVSDVIAAKTALSATSVSGSFESSPININSLRQVELPNGWHIVSPFPPETEYLYRDIFEYQTNINEIIEYPTNGCVFDIGANVGLFTLFVLERRLAARVFAFEPAPPLYEALKHNTSVFSDRIKLFNIGLSNSEAMRKLRYYPMLSGMSSFYPDEERDRVLLRTILKNLAGEGEANIVTLLQQADEYFDQRLRSQNFPCRTRTLSDVMAETDVEVIDVLKIDVQRSEIDVLDGIRLEDWRRIRQLVIEVHDINHAVDTISKKLAEYDYRITVKQHIPHNGSVVRFIYAARRTGQ